MRGHRRVEKLLNKLLVSEFTKSRAHRTTDNALVEGKNGAVVRKHIGHEPIAAEHADGDIELRSMGNELVTLFEDVRGESMSTANG